MAPKPEIDGDQSPDEILSKYKRILQSNGITDEVADVIVKDAGLRGEGMASQSLYVTVVFKNPDLKNLNLFVKAHTKNESHSEMINDLKIFDKEAKFLVDYVRAARTMCKSKGQEELMDIYPHCYYGDGDMTVMENLVLDKGYSLVDKELRQNLEETQYVTLLAVGFAIRTIAKHHAVSYAMIQIEGGADKFLEKYPELGSEMFNKPHCVQMMQPWMDDGLKTVIRILENNKTEGQAESLDFLKLRLGKPFSIMLKNLEYNPEEEKLLIINHGDYWNNNMMFLKDKETGKTIGHKAIDLQVTRYNSPVTDLAYYLFTSVQPSVRQAHLHDILDLYLDTLKQTARDLGHPIELTSEELLTMYRTKFEYGYWIGLCNTSGANFAVLKDVDMNEIGDMKNIPAVVDKLTRKWIIDNPEKVKVIAEEIVSVVKEFKQLSLK